MNGNAPSDSGNRPEDATFARGASRDPLIDTTLDGRFHIEEVLGTGGMSVVYKARQLRVNRHVAIKTIRLQLDSKPVYKERFQREISSLCALNHPNIVTVYDCIIGPDEQPYVVMDYLRGRSLESLIKSEGPIDLERFASIAMQVCSALDHAHKKGIIHRDLKPGNIVLLDEETDVVKVVDFGLAKLSEDNRKLTQSGELWGSPPYMSPEQCMGESGDERSDIYSLGVVMYEMIVGRDPFCDATSVFELIQRHVHASPPPFFHANPNVSAPLRLESAIFKALEKSPLDRYQSAHELQDAIVEACSHDSGNLIYHPSRAGRTTSGSGIDAGAARSSANRAVEADSPRSAQSQQAALFAGMRDAGLPDSIALPSSEAKPNDTTPVRPAQERTALGPYQPQRKEPVVPLDAGVMDNPKTRLWLPLLLIVVLAVGLGGVMMFMPRIFKSEQTSMSQQSRPVTKPAITPASDKVEVEDGIIPAYEDQSPSSVSPQRMKPKPVQAAAKKTARDPKKDRPKATQARSKDAKAPSNQPKDRWDALHNAR